MCCILFTCCISQDYSFIKTSAKRNISRPTQKSDTHTVISWKENFDNPWYRKQVISKWNNPPRILPHCTESIHQFLFFWAAIPKTEWRENEVAFSFLLADLLQAWQAFFPKSFVYAEDLKSLPRKTFILKLEIKEDCGETF